MLQFNSFDAVSFAANKKVNGQKKIFHFKGSSGSPVS